MGNGCAKFIASIIVGIIAAAVFSAAFLAIVHYIQWVIYGEWFSWEHRAALALAALGFFFGIVAMYTDTED